MGLIPLSPLVTGLDAVQDGGPWNLSGLHEGGEAATMMKLNKVATLTWALGSFFLISPAAYAAQEQCSIGKLQGQYVSAGQGANLHYGIFNFDGAGKFQGKQTSAREQANAQREDLTGTYTLDADCTGTMTFEGQNGTEHWDVFVTEDGKKGRMIRTDPGVAAVRSFEQ
jgi:hypothetical protein